MICEPQITLYGGTVDKWLAVSPGDFPYRIGVVGNTPDQAKHAFKVAVEAWAALAEQLPAAAIPGPSVAGT